MTDNNDSDLIAYVLGDAPADVAAKIRTQAGTDPELAAEIDVLRDLWLPGNVDGTSPTVVAGPRFTGLSRWGRRIAAGIAVLLFVGGVSWAGYEWMRTPPLLSDDFSSGTVSTTKWAVYLGRRGVRAEHGYLRLLNRGSLVTRQEFDGPIEISFDWRWIDQGDWPLYADNLHVALRTSGLHQNVRPFSVEDGIVVEFNGVKHNITVVHNRGNYSVDTPADSTPFPADAWHHIRIVDDGVTISVYISGPAIDPRYKRVPVLVATPPAWPEGKNVAFFNRERLASTDHESHIDNVVIRAIERK